MTLEELKVLTERLGFPWEYPKTVEEAVYNISKYATVIFP